MQRGLAEDPARLAEVMRALRRYQEADRSFMTAPGQVIDREGRACLRAPRSVSLDGPPDIVFVPSPINAPDILDMHGECSLMRWLAARGHRPALTDWGKVTPGHADERLETLAEHYLLPMLARIGRPVHLVGYCLGGLVAIAAAHLAPVASLGLIATPWHFDRYPARRRDMLRSIWSEHAPLLTAMRLVPMEVMQAGFWALAKDRLAEKYLGFGAMTADSEAARKFIAIEDWANGGEPLPLAMGRQVFAELFGDDASGRGEWIVGGRAIDPGSLPCPAFEFASSRDAIVPLATSPALADRAVLSTGHVGMMVGGRAPHELWPMLEAKISGCDPR